MLTVHLVPFESLEEHSEAQRAIRKTTEVVIGDGASSTDAARQARDAAVLARKKDVVAVVASIRGDPSRPAKTQEWLELADEVIAISRTARTLVKMQW